MCPGWIWPALRDLLPRRERGCSLRKWCVPFLNIVWSNTDLPLAQEIAQAITSAVRLGSMALQPRAQCAPMTKTAPPDTALVSQCAPTATTPSCSHHVAPTKTARRAIAQPTACADPMVKTDQAPTAKRALLARRAPRASATRTTPSVRLPGRGSSTMYALQARTAMLSAKVVRVFVSASYAPALNSFWRRKLCQ